MRSPGARRRTAATGRGAGVATRVLALALLVPLLLAPAPAGAYDFEITSRTEGYGYQLRRYEQDGVQFLNRRRVTQYLGLRVFNLLDPGDAAFGEGTRRPPAVLTFHVQLRLDAEFGAFGDASPRVPEIDGNQLDLLLGALEGRNLWGRVDFSLGRQVELELFDIFAFDGLRVRVNSPWHIYVEAQLGSQVAGAHPFSATVVQTDGASGDHSREAWSPTLGVAVGVDDLRWLSARLSYRGVASRAARIPGDAARAEDKIWGVNQEILCFGAAAEVPRLRLRPQVGLRYNFLTARLDDLQAGASVAIGSRVEAHVELLRSRPHFDGDSIWNIFSVEPFSELAGRVTVQLGEALSVGARGGRRWYWSDAAEGELAERGVTTLGAAATWRQLGRRAALEAYYLGGADGATLGADLDGSWALRRWLSLEGRLSLLRLHDSQRQVGAVINFGFQAGATVRLARGARLLFLLEDNVSRLYSSALRLLGVLDLEFAP